ncbi:hypothetical protein CTEN210_06766 [Chaetoceros tenuissimus]|uniref:Leucine-rich repeat domain-containing protein n=1 Tax=Chaetoceros tenuissimus TaxID=426638 RepID=A0AAD3CSK3_9STRA|nr:hypothetical protein CTEN210_06766 [Chaetoceros tenuissimus]
MGSHHCCTGVEVIPDHTFCDCYEVEKVIMSDTVKKIEEKAFNDCVRLEYVKLSRNLEFIGDNAFDGCRALTSIFIPPTCTEIGSFAFQYCQKLIILSLPNHTQLGEKVIEKTALIRASAFEIDENGGYHRSISENVNEWIRNINGDDDQFAVHRSCSSFNPLTEIIYQIVRRQGFKEEERVRDYSFRIFSSKSLCRTY